MPTLRPYQIECQNFLKKWNGRALIADPPGAGKTAEGLSWLTLDKAHLPALIVCTANAKLQWRGEWKKWIGDAPLYIASSQTPRKSKWGNKTSILINWEILHYWRAYLPTQFIKTIIPDEAHKAGDFTSQRTKALVWLNKYSRFFIPMSGTPVLSKPGQFFPLLHMLDSKRFHSPYLFQTHYCNMKKDPFTGKIKEYQGGKNLGELHNILSDYMIRREKREILKDLPPKNTIPVPLEIENRKEYYKQEIQTKNSLRTLNVLDGLNAIKRLKGTAFSYKQKAVIEWIKDFLETEEPLLVFAYHKAVLSFLENHFGARCVKIDGTVKGKRRERALSLFKNGRVNLMFAQIDAMGEAIDGLQDVCSSCAFVEFHRSATKHDQAESRLERSGQKYVIYAYYLIAANTIDEELMCRLDQQTKTLSKMYRGEEVNKEDLLMYIYNKWKRGK